MATYNSDVYALQVFLEGLNPDDTQLPQFGADGKWGQETLQALQNYQNLMGLPVTQSITDTPPTLASLGVDTETDDDDSTDTVLEEVESGASGTVDTDDTEVVEEENNDAMKNAFVAAIGMIGITGDAANSLWEDIQTKFIEDDTYTVDNALLDMYGTAAFEERFPGITKLMEERGALDEAGNVIASPGEVDLPTVGEYLELEQIVSGSLDSLGGAINWETGNNFSDLIENLIVAGVDALEAKDRIDLAVRVTDNAPQEVKDYFSTHFSNGSGALAQVFLDPDDTWSQIQEEVETAEVGGWAEIYGGIEIGTNEASRIANLNMNAAAVWDSFGQIKEQEALFVEKLGEQDFTAQEEGIESAFFGDDSLNRRRQQRVAEFSGGGGAMLTQEGTGLGSA